MKEKQGREKKQTIWKKKKLRDRIKRRKDKKRDNQKEEK